jgi:hypothetical protein
MNPILEVYFMKESKPDLLSRLIMWWQGTNYSHVGFEYKGMLYHAIGNGVVWQKPEEYLHDHEVVLKKSVNLNCSVDRFEGYLMGEIGKDYSELQLWRIVTQKAYSKVGIKMKSNGDAKRVCSEFVGMVLFLFSKHKISGDRDYWTPKCIEKALFPIEYKDQKVGE